MSKTFDLGPVSAYALAVKHGYEGTEEQWVAEMESKRKEAVASAESASESATEAVNSAAASANSASTASTKADEAGNSATRAESYAVGGTGIRQNEDVDNAKYYYQQVKQISGGLSGALAPMGTILFDDLQNQTKQAGYMYNVVDAFTTDETFKEGAGYTYPEGTNVYYTVDGYWDCLAGTITPAGIGALEVDGDSKDNIVSFTSNDEAEPTSWSKVETLTSKEKHSSILSKISTMFKNVRYLYKMLGTTDISAMGDGTVTGAISAINNNLKNQYLYKHRLFTKSVLVNFIDGKATVDLGITPLKTTQILMIPTADSTIATRPVEIKAGANTVELIAYTNGGNLMSGTYWINLWGYLVC